ncbi:MAG: hypothetical protein K2P99_04470, partial [Burkholderiales bacterium]|nr:hypothetical protein [Burkholderiales bacterium]
PLIAGKILRNQIKLTLNDKLEKTVNEMVKNHKFNELDQYLKENEISWNMLSKPFQVKDSFISSLGSASKLKEIIFDFKTKGEISPIIEFGGQKAIIRFLSKSSPTNSPSLTPEEQSSDLPAKFSPNNLIERIERYQSSQALFLNTQKKLYDEFEKKGKIKINSSLNP